MHLGRQHRLLVVHGRHLGTGHALPACRQRTFSRRRGGRRLGRLLALGRGRRATAGGQRQRDSQGKRTQAQTGRDVHGGSPCWPGAARLARPGGLLLRGDAGDAVTLRVFGTARLVHREHIALAIGADVVRQRAAIKVGDHLAIAVDHGDGTGAAVADVGQAGGIVEGDVQCTGTNRHVVQHLAGGHIDDQQVVGALRGHVQAVACRIEGDAGGADRIAQVDDLVALAAGNVDHRRFRRTDADGEQLAALLVQHQAHRGELAVIDAGLQRHRRQLLERLGVEHRQVVLPRSRGEHLAAGTIDHHVARVRHRIDRELVDQ
ncbi:hypothetical protein G6F31_014205 [Rhizopus arrhizus]|nr:hypothetical protein G6F31_014205 [Rhizopus arrhizus]